MSWKPSSLLDWLGRRLGSSAGSSDRQFDQLLSQAIDEFNDVLRTGYETQPEGAARQKLHERAEAAGHRFETLAPPSAQWAEVVNDYRELAAIHLRYFGEVLPESAQRDFAAINRRADTRREELREAYRQDRAR
jgi:hypothetical protein